MEDLERKIEEHFKNLTQEQLIENVKNLINKCNSKCCCLYKSLINYRPIRKMYKIKFQDYKIVVVCKSCYNRGELNENCKECGGKGTHNKTKQKWEVCKSPIDICKIDRDKNGELRYWTDMSCFF